MTKIARLGLTLMLFAIAAVGQDSGEPGKYLLLATNRTGTMEKELNAVSPEYDLVAMTVFQSTFGGNETVAILEDEVGSDHQ